MNDKPADVDSYIQTFPTDVQQMLQTVRRTIREFAPDAVESSAYDMPAYKLKGKPLSNFGGSKSCIGFYAAPNGHSAFVEELSKYKQGKGSVQFPLDEPMPRDLIERIVRFRVEQIHGGAA